MKFLPRALSDFRREGTWKVVFEPYLEVSLACICSFCSIMITSALNRLGRISLVGIVLRHFLKNYLKTISFSSWIQYQCSTSLQLEHDGPSKLLVWRRCPFSGAYKCQWFYSCFRDTLDSATFKNKTRLSKEYPFPPKLLFSLFLVTILFFKEKVKVLES